MLTLKRPVARRTAIGIDLGRRGVRAAQLRRQGDGWVVPHQACLEHTGADGAEETDAGELGRMIRECVGVAECRGRDVSVVLSPPDVEFHSLELPSTVIAKARPQVTGIVRTEVQRLMGSGDGGFEVDYWTLPRTGGAAPNVLGAVAKSRVVKLALDACSRAGVECRRIDTVATSLCRLGSLLKEWREDELWGMLDVGCRQARLVLCMDDVPVLIRTMGFGGDTWTQRIADALDISPQAAEVQKCEHGLTLPRSVGPDLGERQARGELGSMLFGVLRGDLNGLAAEIKKSYEYSLSCYPSRKPSDLVLVGGGAALRGLPEFLTSELGISVRRVSSYPGDGGCEIQYQSGKRNRMDVFAATLGLALES